MAGLFVFYAAYESPLRQGDFCMLTFGSEGLAELIFFISRPVAQAQDPLVISV